MTHNTRLPSSWTECTLGDIVPYGSTRKAEPQEIPANSWVLELEDIEKDTSRVLQRITFAERHPKSTKNKFSRGDVLYGKLRPYLNKVIRARESGYCTTEIIPLTPPAGIDGGYLFFWLKHPRFREYVNSVSHGLHMPRLGTEAGKAAPLVIAPSLEQTRIADRLEALIERVDACRERLDRIPSILRRFRQSVLDAATSGELTVEWRESRGKSKDDWQSVSIEELVTIKNGRAFPSADYTTHGVHLLRPGNLHGSGRVEWDKGNTRYLPPRYATDYPDFVIRGGELLMNLTAQSLKDEFLGRVCLKAEDTPALLNQRICAFYPVTRWDSRPYLFVYFRSPAFRRYVDTLDSGTLIKHIHSRQLLTHRLPLPPEDEAEEVCRRVDSLLGAAESIERKNAILQRQMRTLPDALLATAFRGALVPQNPDDEPASELLERIRLHYLHGDAGPPRASIRAQRTRAKAETNMLTRKDVTPTHLTTILKARGALTAEALWAASQLDIDAFYEQLKDEEARGLLTERRGDTPTSPRVLEML